MRDMINATRKCRRLCVTLAEMFAQELSLLSLFRGMSEQQITSIEALFELRTYGADQIIFDQGRRSDYLYILVKGEVGIRYKPYDGPAITVARIAPGGVFGWSAALGRERYTSAAVTLTPIEALRISAGELRCFLEHEPETGTLFMQRLADAIAERIKNTKGQVLDILSQGMDTIESDCGKRMEANGHQ